MPTRSPLRAEVPTIDQFEDLADTVAELEDTPPSAHTHTTEQVTGFTAAVDARVQQIVGAAPAALDTLAELADALGDDADFAGTVTTALAGKQPLHATLTGLSGLTLANDTVLVRVGGAFVLMGFADFKDALGIVAADTSGPLFDVEQHGAVPDGATDCYAAFLAAHNAMLALSTGGRLFTPTIGTYRVALDPARVHTWPDDQWAAFPIPVLPRTGPKLAYGIKGVGEAYVERAAELGGTPGQVATASVVWFDYDPDDFAWSPTAGLPSVFGCADADATDPVGNSFSHVHFSVDDVILRNTPDPSLTILNLEQCSSARFGRVRFDVDVVLDLVPEPTRPTGAAFLLPRTNNNVTIQVDSVITVGHYAGVHLTEHCEIRRAVSLRCKAAVFTRRPNSHIGHVGSLKVEQCPWGITGWDPSGAVGAGPGGIVGVHGWTGVIGSWGIEDYAYNGVTPWIYAPTEGAHVNDPAGTLNGETGMVARINSEDPEGSPGGGIGIGPEGGSNSLYVIGPGGTTASPMAFYAMHHGQAATRLLPPSAPEVTEHRLFAGQSGPSTAPTEGSGINVGLKIRVSAACEAVALSFWRLNTDVNPTVGRLWKHTAPSTWENLGDVAFTPAGTAVWVDAELPAPVPLETETDAPTVTYVAAVHYPGNYPREGNYWGGGPGGSGLVVPPLKVYSDADAGGQGVFSMGDITVPPTISGSGADYGVDLVVTTEA